MCFLQVHEKSVAAWRRGVQSHANWRSWRNLHWDKVHASKPQTHAMCFFSQTRASKWSLTVFHSWHCYAPWILRLGNLDLDHVDTSKHMDFSGYWVTCAAECWHLYKWMHSGTIALKIVFLHFASPFQLVGLLLNFSFALIIPLIPDSCAACATTVSGKMLFVLVPLAPTCSVSQSEK